MKKVFVSNIKLVELLESKEKLILPLSQQMTQYYPKSIREDYRGISEVIVDSGAPYLEDRQVIIDASDVYIEDWVVAIEHLLKKMGRDIIIPLSLFFNEYLDETNFDYFIYELQNSLLSRGWKDIELKDINFLIVF